MSEYCYNERVFKLFEAVVNKINYSEAECPACTPGKIKYFFMK